LNDRADVIIRRKSHKVDVGKERRGLKNKERKPEASFLY